MVIIRSEINTYSYDTLTDLPHNRCELNAMNEQLIEKVLNAVSILNEPNIADFIAAIGPLVGGIGLIIGAVIALITYHFVHARSLEINWLNNFNSLYHEFWKDNEIAEVRQWITSENDYGMICKVLSNRGKPHEKNELASSDNEKLEKLDRFISLMVRIKFFRKITKKPSHKKLYDLTFYYYWREKIKSRKEIMDYIDDYWNGLNID